MRAQGRKQRWLAAQLGFNESHFTRALAGRKTLSREQAEILCRILGVPLFLIFDCAYASEHNADEVTA